MLLTVLVLGACHPLDPEPPSPTPPAADTSGSETEATHDDGASILPPPPSATLRAPADDRRDEVDPETGAAPP
jgi:hypothetical protein